MFVKRKVREPGGGPPTLLSLRQHSPRLWLTNQPSEVGGGLGWVRLGKVGDLFYHLLKPATGAKYLWHDWMLTSLSDVHLSDGVRCPRKEKEKRL